jgi:hypothetical protein
MPCYGPAMAGITENELIIKASCDGIWPAGHLNNAAEPINNAAEPTGNLIGRPRWIIYETTYKISNSFDSGRWRDGALSA